MPGNLAIRRPGCRALEFGYPREPRGPELVGLFGVLRFAVTEGPVFLRYLDEVDQYVLAADLQPPVQSVGDRPVKRPLDVHGASGVECHLDEDTVFGPRDPQVPGVEYEVLTCVLGDYLEPVVRGDSERLGHGFVDDRSDLARVADWLAVDEVNAHQWHGSPCSACSADAAALCTLGKFRDGCPAQPVWSRRARLPASAPHHLRPGVRLRPPDPRPGTLRA